MTDLAKASISISYMPRFAFCRDCARLGRKKYRSEARMIFSFQPVRRSALPNRRQKATFAGKN